MCYVMEKTPRQPVAEHATTTRSSVRAARSLCHYSATLGLVTCLLNGAVKFASDHMAPHDFYSIRHLTKSY